MKKTNGATRKSRTHFEQVPIDVVKRVAKEDVSQEETAAIDKVIREPAPGKSRPPSVPARSLPRERR
jgi:hypothetical protein